MDWWHQEQSRNSWSNTLTVLQDVKKREKEGFSAWCWKQDLLQAKGMCMWLQAPRNTWADTDFRSTLWGFWVFEQLKLSGMDTNRGNLTFCWLHNHRNTAATCINWATALSWGPRIYINLYLYTDGLYLAHWHLPRCKGLSKERWKASRGN